MCVCLLDIVIGWVRIHRVVFFWDGRRAPLMKVGRYGKGERVKHYDARYLLKEFGKHRKFH